MKLEPGMRVRCVDACYKRLTLGKEYTITRNSPGRPEYVGVVDDRGYETGWIAERFKPVVRVKANTARPISRTLVERIEHHSWVNRQTKWIERTDRSPQRHIFAQAGQ